MSKTSQKVHLDKDGDIFDGIFLGRTSGGGYIKGKFQIVEDIEIEYSLDSPEGRALINGLTKDMVGKRVLVANIGGILKIALKSPEGC